MLIENLVICPTGEAPEKSASRVLWTAAGSNDVCLIRIFDPCALPEWHKKDKILQAISSERYFYCNPDPVAWLLTQDTELSEAQIKKRDKRWKDIQSLFSGGPLPLLYRRTRGQLLRAVAIDAEITSRQLIKVLRRFWQLGQCREALTPHFNQCGTLGENKFRPPGLVKRGRERLGGNDGINVDEKVFRQIEVAVRKYVKGTRGFSNAYDQLIIEHYGGDGEDGLPRRDIPTIEQFYYHARKLIDRPRAIRDHVGDTEFSLNYRTLATKDPETLFGPGAEYQADATNRLDTMLRSEHNPGLLIGKPIVYIVFDDFSHLWIGFHVGLENASWGAAMLAFECAFTPKVEYFERFGVTITEDEHPVHSMCQSLTVDKGPEFMSQHAAAMADQLEIDLGRTPTRRADIKGLVESHFRTLKRYEENEPGFTGDRKPRDPPKKISGNLLTLKEFTRRLIRLMLDYNRSHPVTDLPPGYTGIHDRHPTPLDLWKWGIENIGHPVMPPPYLRSKLLYKAQATSTPKGLRVRGRFYTAPEVAHLEVRGTGVKNRSLSVRYDPRDVAKVLILGPRGEPPIECSLTPANSHLAGLSEKEFKEIRGENNRKTRTSRKIRQDSKGKTQRQNQEDLAQRPERLPDVRRPNTNLSRADRQARVIEHRENQRYGAWTAEDMLVTEDKPLVSTTAANDGSYDLANYDSEVVARLRARLNAKKAAGAQ